MIENNIATRDLLRQLDNATCVLWASCFVLTIYLSRNLYISDPFDFSNWDYYIPGAFTSLNAEEIENEVGDMWRSMYKLTKTFSDQPGPRRIADSVKGKIDKFKQHLPILHTICNPGIRDRHWEAVSYSQSLYRSGFFVSLIMVMELIMLL